MTIPFFKKMTFSMKADKLAEISLLLTAIEKKCDLEIVPIIWKSDIQGSTYPQLMPRLVLFHLIVLQFTLLFLSSGGRYLNDYFANSLTNQLVIEAGLIIIAVLMSYIIQKYFSLIAMNFLSRDEKKQFVERAAQQKFTEFKFNQIARNNALVLYISVLERKVTLWADHKILDKISFDLWSEYIQEARPLLNDKKWEDALLFFLKKLAPHFEEQFPDNSSGEEVSENQISDNVITNLTID